MLNAVTLALFKATIVIVTLHFAASAVARLLTWLDDWEGTLFKNVLGGKLRWVTAPLFMKGDKTPKRWLYPWFAIEITSRRRGGLAG